MTRTYLFGYDETNPPWYAGRTRRTELYIRSHWRFVKCHPELMDRAFALCDAAQDAGTDLGFGDGVRYFIDQDKEFRRRHYVVPCPGLVSYDGRCWQRHSWAAPYAPPGRSWHEERASNMGGMALDLVGNHAWATPRCANYGLRNGDQGEPWHYVCREIPAGRPLNFVWTSPLPDWGGNNPPPPPPPPSYLEDDMPRALPHGFAVAYDSRPEFWHLVDPVLAGQNADEPRFALQPGDVRKVFVGLGDPGNPAPSALVSVTAIGMGGNGFVAIGPRINEIRGAVANFDGGDRVDTGVALVAIPEGHVYVQANIGACDVVVTVQGRS